MKETASRIRNRTRTRRKFRLKPPTAPTAQRGVGAIAFISTAPHPWVQQGPELIHFLKGGAQYAAFIEESMSIVDSE